MLQYNPEFSKAFRKVNRRFFKCFSDIFDHEKYPLFFKQGSIKEIEKYFADSQQFVVNLIHHIKTQENGKNDWSRYFIDLTTLLCSGMDTDLRSHSIDNARARVDISRADLDIIFEDIQNLKKIAHKENPSLICLVVPTDFTMLYNVGDYVLVGVDMSNRKLIKPHVYEAKRQKVPKTSYKHGVEIQQQREERQINRMTEQKFKYEMSSKAPRLNGFYKYVTFFVGNNKIKNFLKRPEEIFRIDEVFSLHVTKKDKLHVSKEEWCVDFLDEIFCGGVIPGVFRNIPLKHIDKLMRQNIHLFFRVDKKAFRESLLRVKGVKSVDKHPSPSHAYINFEKFRFSVANTIHAKYPICHLLPVFEESIESLKYIYGQTEENLKDPSVA